MTRLNDEERALARGLHAIPAVDGRYYDAVSAAIADRDDLLDAATSGGEEVNTMEQKLDFRVGLLLNSLIKEYDDLCKRRDEYRASPATEFLADRYEAEIRGVRTAIACLVGIYGLLPGPHPGGVPDWLPDLRIIAQRTSYAP